VLSTPQLESQGFLSTKGEAFSVPDALPLWTFFTELLGKVEGRITGAAISIAPNEELKITDLGIQVVANATQCGTVNGSITLTANITTTGTCFDVNNSNITLDGAGYTITGDAGSLDYGIISTSFNNITVKNFAGINNFTNGIRALGMDNSTIYNNTIASSGPGIYMEGSNNTLISSNNINTSGNADYGIFLDYSSNNSITSNIISTSEQNSYGIFIDSSSNNSITSNDISTSNSSSYGINMEGSNDNSISSNNISTSDSTSSGIYSYGIFVRGSNNTLISSNDISTSSQGTHGIYLDDSSNNSISSNNISTSGSEGDGINMQDSSSGNTLLNNNISTADCGIRDTTGNSSINYLIYNNSFGEIHWTDNSTNGFLRNLNVGGNIGLGINLFIGNNTVALNTSAFDDCGSGASKINSSANITLYNLTLGLVDVIYKSEDYFTNSSAVKTNGSLCTGCNIFNYSNVTGTLIFNTTSFSSFTAVQDLTSPIISNEAVDVTSIYVNFSVRLNATVTDDLSVDTVKFYVEPFGNLTATKNGDEYYLVCNSTNTCNTTETGSYNWTSVWANDTVNKVNTTTPNLQFNVTTTPTVSIVLVSPTTNTNFTANQSTVFTVNVSCSVTDCGEINVSLDPITGCDVAISTCGSCGDLFSDATAGWNFAGGVCLDGTGGYVTAPDASCDGIGVGGANDEDCGARNDGTDISYCPSYDRLGSAVSSGDCLCATAPCAGSHWDEYDFTNEFFSDSSSAATKSGLISTTSGDTPFWTNTSNPYNITLNENQSQLVTWYVNTTGNVDTEHTFFAYANITSELSVSANTSSINITIIADALTTTLSSPGIAYYNDSSATPTINFTCSATDDTELRNITFYLTNSSNQSLILNQTTVINGTSNSSNWLVTFSVMGNYSWNCLTYDDQSNLDWATNQSFILNYTAPATAATTTTTSGSSGDSDSGAAPLEEVPQEAAAAVIVEEESGSSAPEEAEVKGVAAPEEILGKEEVNFTQIFLSRLKEMVSDYKNYGFAFLISILLLIGIIYAFSKLRKMDWKNKSLLSVKEKGLVIPSLGLSQCEKKPLKKWNQRKKLDLMEELEQVNLRIGQIGQKDSSLIPKKTQRKLNDLLVKKKSALKIKPDQKPIVLEQPAKMIALQQELAKIEQEMQGLNKTVPKKIRKVVLVEAVEEKKLVPPKIKKGRKSLGIKEKRLAWELKQIKEELKGMKSKQPKIKKKV
ncbi:MAG: NosD domain-containing protein, partial [Candidatus Woesearchaeota archaeon]